MPDECSKAIARRLRDPNFAAHYFVGHGLDVGGGSDGLGTQGEHWPGMLSCRTWDMPDGDAQFLESVPPAAYDFVHSSHCLEHMVDPVEALAHWIRVCKPGGHITVMIPDEDMYEQGVFPSTFNGDHKWTFTMFKVASWSKRSVNVLNLLTRYGQAVDVIKVEQLHGSYDWQADTRHDQTGGAGECAIEFVLRKRHGHEIDDGGRFAKWHPTTNDSSR